MREPSRLEPPPRGEILNKRLLSKPMLRTAKSNLNPLDRSFCTGKSAFFSPVTPPKLARASGRSPASCGIGCGDSEHRERKQEITARAEPAACRALAGWRLPRRHESASPKAPVPAPQHQGL